MKTIFLLLIPGVALLCGLAGCQTRRLAAPYPPGISTVVTPRVTKVYSNGVLIRRERHRRPGKRGL